MQEPLFTGGRTGPGGEAPGRFYGPDATPTERAAGEAVEEREEGHLNPGSVGHAVLLLGFGDGLPRTAYEASVATCGNPHDRRREATRLMGRGYLRKNGTRPNRWAPGARDVDVYVLTANGRAALDRLGALPSV
jgi:hypothetical protein